MLKVMGTSLVEANLQFSFLPPFPRGQLLKERIYSCESKFFHLRIDLILESFTHRKSEQEVFFP